MTNNFKDLGIKLGKDLSVNVQLIINELKWRNSLLKVQQSTHSSEKLPFVNMNVEELTGAGYIFRKNACKRACPPLLVPKPVKKDFNSLLTYV